MSKIEIIKLKNGETIILNQNKNTDVLFMGAGFKAGLINEKKLPNGIAHFLEHMCFNGSEKYPAKDELVFQIEQCGLQSNAFTDYNFTLYYLLGVQKNLSQIVDFLGELSLFSLLKQDFVKKECSVITQEIDFRNDLYDVYLQEKFEENFFNLKSIIGTKSSIKKINSKNLKKFKADNYTSKNLVILISGNFNKVQALALIKEKFQFSKNTNQANLSFNPEINYNLKHSSFKKNGVDSLYVNIGALAPNPKSPDYFIFFLLNKILLDSQSSRLWLEIREKHGLCYVLNSCFQTQEKFSFFNISSQIDKSKLPLFLSLLAQELKKIKEQKVSIKELEKVKEMAKNSFSISLESTKSKAFNNLINYLNIGSASENLNFKKKIDAVGINDIQRVAKKYLIAKNFSCFYLNKDNIKKIVSDKFLKNI